MGGLTADGINPFWKNLSYAVASFSIANNIRDENWDSLILTGLEAVLSDSSKKIKKDDKKKKQLNFRY